MSVASPLHAGSGPATLAANPKTLMLQSVWGSDRTGPRGAARGAVKNLLLHRGPGVLAILGAPEDGTLALAELLSGQRRPERGRVLVSGREPHRDAALRARIGALGLVPELSPGRTTLASVALALAARWDDITRPEAVLEQAGLAALDPRALSSLSFAEARAVDLALALAVSDPWLLVLSDPFSEIASVSTSFILERIRVLSEVCPVVVLTSSPRDARRVTSGRDSDLVLVLHRGVFARAGDAEGRLSYPRRAEICAWASGRLRELVKRLGDDPAVLGLSWEPTAMTDDGEAGVVRVAGVDPSALALAIADAATETGAPIVGITEVEPTLAEVRTTTEWIRHASHVAASAVSRAPGPGAVEVPASLAPTAAPQLPDALVTAPTGDGASVSLPAQPVLVPNDPSARLDAAPDALVTAPRDAPAGRDDSRRGDPDAAEKRRGEI